MEPESAIQFLARILILVRAGDQILAEDAAALEELALTGQLNEITKAIGDQPANATPLNEAGGQI